jgi:hypothetical protein
MFIELHVRISKALFYPFNKAKAVIVAEVSTPPPPLAGCPAWLAAALTE